MTISSDTQPCVVRTERGLTISRTRITLYDVMDYLAAGFPPALIRDKLNLTEQQIDEAIEYIQANRAQVEAEHKKVIQAAQEIRQYWEAKNSERISKATTQPENSVHKAIQEKLQGCKARAESKR